MKKVFSQFVIAVFVCNFFMLSKAWAVTSVETENQVNKVYLHNKYIVSQLENLTRALKKQPHRIGTHLKKVDIRLLNIKLNSLNYLMQREAQPSLLLSYKPLTQNMVFDYSGLLQESERMLKILPELFIRYQQPVPSAFDQSSSLGWFDQEISHHDVYHQFLRIESILYGIKHVIEPANVYDVVLSIHAILAIKCSSSRSLKSVPLVMGKRPKEVYFQLNEYLKSLSRHTGFILPEKGPVHIFPHDVFDLSIVALSHSLELLNDEEKASIILQFEAGKLMEVRSETTVITPSHVFQKVAENITLLECM